ncbi:MAG: hypothetical protein ACRD8W_24530 [Nitrososphaeraceae archaeon]
MTAESNSNRSKEPKNRGEVYKQEQQRILEEATEVQGSHGNQRIEERYTNKSSKGF